MPRKLDAPKLPVNERVTPTRLTPNEQYTHISLWYPSVNPAQRLKVVENQGVRDPGVAAVFGVIHELEVVAKEDPAPYTPAPSTFPFSPSPLFTSLGEFSSWAALAQ